MRESTLDRIGENEGVVSRLIRQDGEGSDARQACECCTAVKLDLLGNQLSKISDYLNKRLEGSAATKSLIKLVVAKRNFLSHEHDKRSGYAGLRLVDGGEIVVGGWLELIWVILGYFWQGLVMLMFNNIMIWLGIGLLFGLISASQAVQGSSKGVNSWCDNGAWMNRIAGERSWSAYRRLDQDEILQNRDKCMKKCQELMDLLQPNRDLVVKELAAVRQVLANVDQSVRDKIDQLLFNESSRNLGLGRLRGNKPTENARNRSHLSDQTSDLVRKKTNTDLVALTTKLQRSIGRLAETQVDPDVLATYQSPQLSEILYNYVYRQSRGVASSSSSTITPEEVAKLKQQLTQLHKLEIDLLLLDLSQSSQIQRKQTADPSTEQRVFYQKQDEAKSIIQIKRRELALIRRLEMIETALYDPLATKQLASAIDQCRADLSTLHRELERITRPDRFNQLVKANITWAVTLKTAFDSCWKGLVSTDLATRQAAIKTVVTRIVEENYLPSFHMDLIEQQIAKLESVPFSSYKTPSQFLAAQYKIFFPAGVQPDILEIACYNILGLCCKDLSMVGSTSSLQQFMNVFVGYAYLQQFSSTDKEIRDSRFFMNNLEKWITPIVLRDVGSAVKIQNVLNLFYYNSCVPASKGVMNMPEEVSTLGLVDAFKESLLFTHSFVRDDMIFQNVYTRLSFQSHILENPQTFEIDGIPVSDTLYPINILLQHQDQIDVQMKQNRRSKLGPALLIMAPKPTQIQTSLLNCQENFVLCQHHDITLQLHPNTDAVQTGLELQAVKDILAPFLTQKDRVNLQELTLQSSSAVPSNEPSLMTVLKQKLAPAINRTPIMVLPHTTINRAGEEIADPLQDELSNQLAFAQQPQTDVLADSESNKSLLFGEDEIAKILGLLDDFDREENEKFAEHIYTQDFIDFDELYDDYEYNYQHSGNITQKGKLLDPASTNPEKIDASSTDILSMALAHKKPVLTQPHWYDEYSQTPLSKLATAPASLSKQPQLSGDDYHLPSTDLLSINEIEPETSSKHKTVHIRLPDLSATTTNEPKKTAQSTPLTPQPTPQTIDQFADKLATDITKLGMAQAAQTQVKPTQVEPTQVDQTQAEQTQVDQTQAEQTQVEQTQAEQTQENKGSEAVVTSSEKKDEEEETETHDPQNIIPGGEEEKDNDILQQAHDLIAKANEIERSNPILAKAVESLIEAGATLLAVFALITAGNMLSFPVFGFVAALGVMALSLVYVGVVARQEKPPRIARNFFLILNIVLVFTIIMCLGLLYRFDYLSLGQDTGLTHWLFQGYTVAALVSIVMGWIGSMSLGPGWSKYRRPLQYGLYIVAALMALHMGLFFNSFIGLATRSIVPVSYALIMPTVVFYGGTLFNPKRSEQQYQHDLLDGAEDPSRKMHSRAITSFVVIIALSISAVFILAIFEEPILKSIAAKVAAKGAEAAANVVG
ncbi:hypothetical protein NEHOM01_1881 [Nematocida homosporus]|uniref:uncharacterized protein n=1 Tax=Nematocida homosporus TaxID=1912981 RepID=UPI0022202027|nr:uncharacterized protein NEHOM01_1881 [Nematocida homosporus]KAI5187036.1 hypothetical protein NEHOM01_1881 [Nematocida homosporus]